MEMPPKAQEKLLFENAKLPLAERLLEVTRHFLGTPYAVSPLGEGQGVDPDPTFRWDKVDCLTFVEESIALALSHRLSDVGPTLQALRYFQEPTYEDRNHLMEAQWLPHNEAKGFLVDVTAQYGGTDVRRVETRLAPSSWGSGVARRLNLPKDRRPTGNFVIRIIPLHKVKSKAANIPTGTVVAVVREHRPGEVTRISHVGFWFRAGDRIWLRHATSEGSRAVVDEDLQPFLARLAKYRDWKVAGLSFYEVRQIP